ncbi:MAG: GGDEF domain-containing protein, partial [Armatimonadota bacterium]
QYREDAKLIRNVASKHVEQIRTNLRIAEKAISIDPLTKLGNRNAFDLQISFAISRLAHGDAYSLAILDVDKFKSINDSYGHLGGDAALIAISKRLTETFSQIGTTVVRFGGDEFAILYKGPKLQLAAKMERVNFSLAKTSFEYNGSKIDLHASYGVIDLSSDHTPDSAFADADYAMYQSKRGKQSAA